MGRGAGDGATHAAGATHPQERGEKGKADQLPPAAAERSNAQATSPAGSSTVKIAPRRSVRFSPRSRPLCSVTMP